MICQKINDDWYIKSGTVSMIESFSDAKDSLQKVKLPHDAMIHEPRCKDTKNGNQTGFYPGGIYTYTKEIDVPKEWEGKTIFLEFEGVSNYPRVYVNGDFAGGSYNSYNSFYVSLEQFLRYGEKNEIQVVAYNIEESSRWYCGGGIYRDVNLLLGDEIHFKIDALKITTPDIRQTEATVVVENVIHNRGRKTNKVWVKTKILDSNGTEVAYDAIPVTAFSQEEAVVRQRVYIENPKLWSSEIPALYTCVSYISYDDNVLDKSESNFGIRTLELSPQTGLKINGVETKLRGACIHLDNGILGAIDLKDAAERKIRLLKEAGFNCIRSSHQPIGKVVLDACDKIGMYVMDELSDMWTRPKNINDYAHVFEVSWEQDVIAMINKDYNHPSVIIYSTGNEIQEAGTAKGSQINRKINEKIKQLDATRYTTNGINGMLAGQSRMGEILAQALGISVEELAKNMPDSSNSNQKEEGGADGLNGMMSVMTGPLADAIANSPILEEMIEEFVAVTDIAGYNYLTALHESEKEKHPNRVVLGTETFPADIVRLWGIVKKHTHVIGDMTWAGYDYLGEAGCGIFHYDGTQNFTSHWPDRTAYIGDLDLNGRRRPISYLRECVYGLRKQPYIAVNRMNRNGQKHSITPWMWKDNISSWTWHGYEGEVASVDVYAYADEVELVLDNQSFGKKVIKDCYVATYEIPYKAGKLVAISYVKGVEQGRFVLETAQEQVQLDVELDKGQKLSKEELVFLTVKLKDQNGKENPLKEKLVTIQVEGAGELLAFGNADPQSMRSYDETSWETFDGEVMAVIRSSNSSGVINVTLEAEGCDTKNMEFIVE